MTSPDQPPSDLAREVYGLLGIPIDVIEMPEVLSRIRSAARASRPYLVSTANLNFLSASHKDLGFRETLLASDLCTADGVPLIWIAKLLGIPLRSRVAGSDMFEALRSDRDALHRLRVFLFGGDEGVAAAACSALNSQDGGVLCAGCFNPGYCGVNEMSSEEVIALINASHADFLVAALGAAKGQEWLIRNHQRITVPVRAHLGATLNFQAGVHRRAPKILRRMGFEWLWRIKEEPKLWRRYADDAFVVASFMLTKILPLMLIRALKRKTGRPLEVERSETQESSVISLNGDATAANVSRVLPFFEAAAIGYRDLSINFSGATMVDARFIGLILMLKKELRQRGLHLKLTDLRPPVERSFRLNGFGYLIGVVVERSSHDAHESRYAAG